MSHEDIQTLLSVEPLGRLGLTDGRRPYVIPMPFVYSGEFVVFPFRLGGRKQLTVQSNHRACFEVDWADMELEEFCSVLIEGRLEQVRGVSEKNACREALMEKYRPPPGKTSRKSPILAMGQGARLIKLVPDSISGRRSAGSTLDWLALAANYKLWFPMPAEGT